MEIGGNQPQAKPDGKAYRQDCRVERMADAIQESAVQQIAQRIDIGNARNKVKIRWSQAPYRACLPIGTHSPHPMTVEMKAEKIVARRRSI